MDINTITYRSGYKISHDYNSAEGQIEVTAAIERDEDRDQACKALRKQVRRWLRDDYEDALRIVGLAPSEKA